MDTTKGKRELDDESEIKDPYKVVVNIILFIVFGVGVFAFSIYIIKFGWPLPIATLGTLEQFGSFGDFVGGLLNPTLQFVIIAMLFRSVDMQKHELRATRKELKQSREANELAASSLQTQAEFQRTQLELDTLDKLLKQRYLEMLEYTKHSRFDVLMIGNTGTDLMTFNDVLEHISVHGKLEIDYIDAASGETMTVKKSINAITPLLKDQLNLIEKYAYEKGSLYFIDFWLSRLYVYVAFYSKLKTSHSSTIVKTFNGTKAKISLHCEAHKIDYQSIASKYHV